MRLKLFLFEEYLFTHVGNYDGEVYVNPSYNEVKELMKRGEVRWIADKETKKIYFWPALTAIHGKILEALMKKGYIKRRMVPHGDKDWKKSNFFGGYAVVTGMRFRVFAMYLADWENDDFSWLEKWFSNINDHIESRKWNRE